MDSFVALITPLGGGVPGVPTHPIAPGGPPLGIWGGPPLYPDQGLPGQPPRPSQGPGFPTNPIVIPPDAAAPGVPTHPIYLPPYPSQGPGFPTHPIAPGGPPPKPDQGLPGQPPRPDQGLPVSPGVPTHPIVYPPGLPATPEHPIALPPTPGLPPLVPSHPIVLPERPPVDGIVIMLPQNKMAPPEGVPPNSAPAILWYGPGTLPMVAWLPAIPPTPKK